MLNIAVWSLLVAGGPVSVDVGPGAMLRGTPQAAVEALCFAWQEDPAKASPPGAPKKGPRGPKDRDELPGPFKFPPNIEAAGTQRESLQKLFEVFEPLRKERQDAIDAVYTASQREAMKAARDKAREAGLKGKDADAEVQAAARLSPEQMEQIEQLREEARELDETIRSAVIALLTRDQKSQLQPGPSRKKAQPKKGPPPGRAEAN